MPNIQELLKIISGPGRNASFCYAKASNTCMVCGKPAADFSNPLAKLEYECSGMCQQCQDRYFN